MVDACANANIGAMAEPDCLGPCEPGTSVTLKGIVWLETDGMLVVKVTWRGKKYAGTLLDCSQPDWAPPRYSLRYPVMFFQSPKSDLDKRKPEEEGKGEEQNTVTDAENDLANYTVTRSSLYSKVTSIGGTRSRRNPGGPGLSNRKMKKPGPKENIKSPPDKETPPPQVKQALSPKRKDDPPIMEDKKEDKVKQEGDKPTTETQDPTPPSTSSYAYKHPGYMQYPHYGAIPFDSANSMYARGTDPTLIPGNPYIHPQLHAPIADEAEVLNSVSQKMQNVKSPAGSPRPHPHLPDPQPLGLGAGGREDVQTAVYSDISDDEPPVPAPEVDGLRSKQALGDKVIVNSGQSPYFMQHYNMYPYYGRAPYLVPYVPPESKPKSSEAKPGLEKEKKDGSNISGEFQHKMLPQHYYVPSYPYNLECGFSGPIVTDEKPTLIKEEKRPGPNENTKPIDPMTLHGPKPSEIKYEPGNKEKHSNDNHHILKENIEPKNQITPGYMYD